MCVCEFVCARGCVRVRVCVDVYQGAAIASYPGSFAGGEKRLRAHAFNRPGIPWR